MPLDDMNISVADLKLEPTTLDGLAVSHLEAMAEAGNNVLECYRVLNKSEANVVGEMLKGQGEFFEWDHYPSGDVYDWETHSQYYYHAHPPENRTHKFGAEHGHFHTFLRPRGMPSNIKPAPVADFEKPQDANDALTHFVGIAMNQAGFPIRLFTTNRWVTGEVWYTADDVISMVERFDIDQALPSWPVNIWITNMVKLFRPEIEVSLRKRDEIVARWEAANPGKNAYEDRELELTSIMDISVEERIKAVDKALKAA